MITQFGGSIAGLLGAGAPGAVTTLNPSDKDPSISLSAGNLRFSGSTAGKSARATTSKASGKSYFECTVNQIGPSLGIGVANSTASTSSRPGADANGIAYYSTGVVFKNNGVLATGLAQANIGDVVGVLLDETSSKIYFHVNGVWVASSDPVGGTGGYAVPTGSLFPMVGLGTVGSGASGGSLNFGQSAFVYTPPAGGNAWG